VTARWRYLDEHGEACGQSRAFEDREEAEAWLTDSWPNLRASDIEEVELLEDGESTYRMSLRNQQG
jgi:hypothetical protein